jgi:hypothetical protein
MRRLRHRLTGHRGCGPAARVGMWLAVLIGGPLRPVAASAQTNGQLWADVTFERQESARQTFAVDVEPRVLVVIPPDEPAWIQLGATPKYTFAATSWLDLGSELYAGYTVQTDDLKSIEATPRLDVELHLFSRDRPNRMHVKELPPKRKVVIRDLVRVEFRNLFYNTDKPNSSTFRFRNRLQILSPLNRELLTSDGAVYVLADWEWFVPLGDPAERFADHQRIRAGFGHRRSYAWDAEALFVWTRSRDTTQSGFATSNYAVDLRLKRRF